MVVREKANTKVILQKGVNTVERAARPTAGYGNVVVTHNYVQIFGA